MYITLWNDYSKVANITITFHSYYFTCLTFFFFLIYSTVLVPFFLFFSPPLLRKVWCRTWTRWMGFMNTLIHIPLLFISCVSNTFFPPTATKSSFAYKAGKFSQALKWDLDLDIWCRDEEENSTTWFALHVWCEHILSQYASGKLNQVLKRKIMFIILYGFVV